MHSFMRIYLRKRKAYLIYSYYMKKLIIKGIKKYFDFFY